MIASTSARSILIMEWAGTAGRAHAGSRSRGCFCRRSASTTSTFLVRCSLATDPPTLRQDCVPALARSSFSRRMGQWPVRRPWARSLKCCHTCAPKRSRQRRRSSHERWRPQMGRIDLCRVRHVRFAAAASPASSIRMPCRSNFRLSQGYPEGFERVAACMRDTRGGGACSSGALQTGCVPNAPISLR